MISVLINVYNRSDRAAFDDYYQEPVRLRLFPNMYESLLRAIDGVKSEIIVTDWNSDDADITKIATGARFIKLEGLFNRGRGKNALAAAANYQWLLFLDADMLIPRRFFDYVREQCDNDVDAWFPHCRYYANANHTIKTNFVNTAFGNMLIKRYVFINSFGFTEEPEWGKEDVKYFQRLKQINGRYIITESNVEGFYHQWHPTSLRKNIV